MTNAQILKNMAVNMNVLILLVDTLANVELDTNYIQMKSAVKVRYRRSQYYRSTLVHSS